MSTYTGMHVNMNLKFQHAYMSIKITCQLYINMQRLRRGVTRRAHTPGTGHNSRGGRPRPAHAAEPPGPLHHGHFGSQESKDPVFTSI